MMFIDPGWMILILLVILLIAGLPIAFVLGVTAATMILLDPAVMPQIIGLIPFGGANNYLLVAALLFMIAAEVMNQGRIAGRAYPWRSGACEHSGRDFHRNRGGRHRSILADALAGPLAALCRDCAQAGARSVVLGGGPLAGLAGQIAPHCPDVALIDGTQAAITQISAQILAAGSA